MSGGELTRFQIWVLAGRPKTLPAAAAPVIVGVGVALSQSVFEAGAAVAALLGALLIQVGTNLANDYFDFKKGADNENRLGPTRVTQAGLLSPEEVAAGMWIVFGLAGVAGLYLLYQAGWPVVLIGLASILAGIAYTGGPFPLGYHGLGDLFVFAFFGPVAVVGTYFVQARAVSPTAVWASLPMGFLATAILVVNNLRDIETDASAGKRTLAVRLGRNGTRVEFLLLCLLAYAVPPIMWLASLTPPTVLLSWLTLIMFIPLLRRVYRETGRPLNAALAETGRLELFFAILFSAGLLLG
jgi:1,4-dihydroxy-2-naphthoate octaprenyltransferase